MWLLALGVVAVALKLLGLGVVAGWSWWVVLSPFAAAALWWTVADMLGITQRVSMRRHEAKMRRRRQGHLDSQGLTTSFGSDTKAKFDARRDRPRKGRR